MNSHSQGLSEEDTNMNKINVAIVDDNEKD